MILLQVERGSRIQLMATVLDDEHVVDLKDIIHRKITMLLEEVNERPEQYHDCLTIRATKIL